MPKFYQLDTNAKYSVLGGGNNLRFYALIISFASIFVSLNTFFLINTILQSEFEIGALIAAFILYAVGFFFLIYSILQYRKNKKKIDREKQIIKTGKLIKGVIIKSSISSFSAYGGYNTIYQHIFNYEFLNQNNDLRLGKLIFQSRIRQNLDVGRKVMVCFNEEDSLILDQYTLLEDEGQKSFDESLSIPKDAFAHSTYKLLNNCIKVDLTKKITTYEMYIFYLVIGLIISLVGLIICSIIFRLAVMPFDTFAGRSIVFLILDIIIFCVTVLPGLGLINIFFKKRRKYRKYFKTCKFTYGKILPSDIFKINDRFVLNYSYFNDKGIEIFSQYKTLADYIRVTDVIIVAYTVNDSILIRKCTIIED